MPGSTAYSGVSVDTGVVTAEQGVATVSGTGISNYDTSDLPVVVMADPNKPERKPSPDGVSTIAPATGQVALNASSATQVIAANANRITANVRNTDPTIAIYIGPSGVTSATGYLLRPLEGFDVKTTGAVYAIAASATPTACYYEEATA